ncbi:MAG: cytochrome b [Geminicoccaceae bacterium]|nr:MAG: cytochrome b [Geminicoccaceae bacterium]
MQLRDDAKTYGAISIVNHWVLAIGIIGLLISGLVIAELLSGPARAPWVWWHKAFGFVAIFWIIWMEAAHRLQKVRPQPDPNYTAFELTARKISHHFLVIGTLALAISGSFMSVFRGREIDVFGWFAVPPVGEIPWIADSANFVHTWGGYLLIAAVLAHAGAALKHHFVSRDNTLARMLGRRQHA